MVKRTLLSRLLAAAYPERCCCCGKAVPCGGLVCEECRAKLNAIEPPVCPSCGNGTCECTCDGHKRHTERCVSPFYYDGAAKSGIYRLKFDGKEYVAELFYTFMAETVKREYGDIDFDAIIPVPIGETTRRKRLYNQSELLGQGLSGLLGVPLKQTLVKLWETSPQRDLPEYRRSGNVLGVYDVDGQTDLCDKVVLLVDDVSTTGATLDECAKMLKIYHAKAVYAVTAASTRLPKKKK